MRFFETKKISLFILFLGFIIFTLSTLTIPFSVADTITSTSFTVHNPVVDAGFDSSSSVNFGLGQSLSQLAIGKSTSASFQVWSGFQYFFEVDANTVSATAGDGQVSLSWTVPDTYLGVAVGDYDVGVGTVSGSYTFENVGNVTSFIKTGLTNGTLYYFKVKAKTASGSFLVFSNETSATPTGASAPSTGSGGGSQSSVGKLFISGFSSPSSAITVLRDGFVVDLVKADDQGRFEILLENIPAGSRDISLYAVDTQGIKSAPTNFSKNIEATITSTQENVFLAPTIQSSHVVVKQGDEFRFFGSTTPGVNLILLANSSNSSNFAASPNGSWSELVDSTSFDLGPHIFRVIANRNGIESTPSTPIEIVVSEDDSVLSPDLVCQRSDLNCDGSVNLVDFSILIYFWNQQVSLSVRADINHSGTVDLVDFSIMLYDWTG